MSGGDRSLGSTVDEQHHCRVTAPYPLDVVQRDLIVGAVVELGCARRSVRRYLQGVFERAAVREAVIPLLLECGMCGTRSPSQ